MAQRQPNPWNLVYPRSPLVLAWGKPLRLLGFVASAILLALLLLLVVFSMVVALGKFGVGPFVEMAAREREWSSVALGALVAALFAWLMGRSMVSQFRNLFVDLPTIEGQIESLTEEDDTTDGGLGQYLSVRVDGRDYVMKFRLRKILRPGQRVKILLWPGTEPVRATRAVWLAW